MIISELPNGTPEIYTSIQGEGLETGRKEVFVRLYGCNLQCSYCDTKYAWQYGKKVELCPETVFVNIAYANCNSVCITGGEPLLQWQELFKLCEILRKNRYFVQLCTNGTLWNDKVFELCDLISMDMKAPSSGMKSNTRLLDKTEDYNTPYRFEIKVVVKDEKDLNFALYDIYPKLHKSMLILQPCADEKGNFNLRKLVEDALPHSLKGVRILPQLHKIIWGTERTR